MPNMNRANFDKLVGLEKRRTSAIAVLEKMCGHTVTAIKLSNRDEITDNRITAAVDTMLRRHLEDEIDTLTMSMESLGVEREGGA